MSGIESTPGHPPQVNSPGVDLDLLVIEAAQRHMRARHGHTIRREDVHRAQTEVGHTLTIERKR